MPAAPLHRLVDLELLATRPLRTDPYRWGYLRHAIAPDKATFLRSTFPRTEFWHLRTYDGEKHMQFRTRPLVPLGADSAVLQESLHPAWRQLADELLAPEYRQAVSQSVGQSLAQAQLEVSAWRWGLNAELGPHLDLPRKLATQVFYFNEAWDPSWGGCLRILGSADIEDTCAELPPALGSASLIMRSEASWHAVPRVGHQAPTERLSVIATWQHPGTESPFWTVDDDGAVHCHAAGSVPDSA